jgi:hypothetical protein
MKPDLNIYIDYLTANEILSDRLQKKAQGGFIAPLLGTVENEFKSHFDSNNKLDSVINFLGPGAVSTLVKLLTGSWWMSALAGLLFSIFHVDLASIIHSMWNALFGDIKSGTVTPSKIDSVANDIAGSFGAISEANEHDLYLIKLAVLNKTAILGSSKVIGLVTKIIGFIFKTVLTSAGLMIAGDVANKAVGRPSGFIPGTLFGGKETNVQPETVHSTQTKFKVSPSYKDVKHINTNWIENITNNKYNIENMVANYAKEVYPQLNSMDGIIKSSPAFQDVVEQIEFYNNTTAGESLVFIPRQFSSKKQLVDHFIDEVAEKTK